MNYLFFFDFFLILFFSESSFLKFFIAIPNPEAISGNFFPPYNNKISKKIITSSHIPIPNIFYLLKIMVYKFFFFKNNFNFYLLEKLFLLRRFYSINFFFILDVIKINIKNKKKDIIFNFLKIKIYKKNFFFFFKKKYFADNFNCLFPRLDTFSILNYFLFFFFYKFNNGLFLDICSGSGFLGFLLFSILNCKIIYLDVSLKALKILRFNLMNFRSLDKNLLLHNNALKANFFFYLNFILICNPPYICYRELSFSSIFNEPINSIIYNKIFGFFFFLRIFYFLSKCKKKFIFFLELNSFNSFLFYKNFLFLKNFFFLLDCSFRVRGFLFLETNNV